MKGQGVASGMLHAMLLKTYADIAKELGVAPGGEFRRAYHEVTSILTIGPKLTLFCASLFF